MLKPVSSTGTALSAAALFDVLRHGIELLHNVKSENWILKTGFDEILGNIESAEHRARHAHAFRPSSDVSRYPPPPQRCIRKIAFSKPV